MKKILLTVAILTSFSVSAQVKIGANPTQIVPGALFQVNGTNAAIESNPNTFIIRQNGDVGINSTAPAGTLYLKSAYATQTAIGMQGPNSGHMWFLIAEGGSSTYAPNSLYVWDYTQNQLRFLIAPNGNVGLGGISNPSSMLDVNGEIEALAIKGPSDIRYKKNIIPLVNPLQKILALNGYTYEWRKDEFPDKKFKTGKDIGLIAQEVEKIVPEVVYTDDNEMQSKSIDYAKLVPLLIEGMKEQQKEIDALKREIMTLKAK